MLASCLLVYGSISLKPEFLASWTILAVVTLVFYLAHITALLMVKSYFRVTLYVFLILCKSFLVFYTNLLQNQLISTKRMVDKS